MKFFDIIKNIMSPAREDDETAEILSHIITTINLAVLPDGSIEIFFTWKEPSEAVARISGELLHKINSGELEQVFVNTLVGYTKQNLLSAKFVNTVFEEWGSHKSSDSPMVKPMDVLRVNGIAPQQ